MVKDEKDVRINPQVSSRPFSRALITTRREKGLAWASAIKLKRGSRGGKRKKTRGLSSRTVAARLFGMQL